MADSLLLSDSRSDTYWRAAIPGLFPELAPVEREDDGCLLNQQGQLCLLSYFTEQNVPVPLAQRVWTWLENIPESHLEPAVLELSPGDPSSHLSNNQAEDIIETSLAILSHDLDSNKDEAMQQNDDEFPVVPVQHNQVDLQHQYQAAYCTPTPIRGNFVPVSGASPSSSRQVLQPAVYEPADNNKNSSAAHFTARASLDSPTTDKMAFSTRSRSRSPAKQQETPDKQQRRSRSLSPVKFSPRRQALRDSILEEASCHQDANKTSFASDSMYPGSSTIFGDRRQGPENIIPEEAPYHQDVNDTSIANRSKYLGSSPLFTERRQAPISSIPEDASYHQEVDSDTASASKGKDPGSSHFFAERLQAPKNSISEEGSYHQDVNDTSLANKSKYPGTSTLIAERRNIASLAPINIDAANARYATNQQARAVAIRRAGTASIIEHRSSRILEEPITAGSSSPKQKFKPTFTGDDASSTYSRMPSGMPTANSARVEPLFMKESTTPYNIEADAPRQPQNPVLGGYQDWLRGREKRQSGFTYPARTQDQTAGSSSQQDDLFEPVETKAEQAGYRGIPYTPLSSVFPGGFETSPRKASKTMIGAKGWLEDTTAPVEKATPTPKKTSFFTGFKTKAKAFMESTVDKGARITAGKPDAPKDSESKQRELLISLDPREQSLLYCELEFIVHQALDRYITAQFNAGRLSTAKLDKINHDWQQKGRPKVVGFRYDVETQLEIVRVHAGDFRFYSRDASPAAIIGTIEMMKTNARAIRVRTYCQPDTVVSKQLLDAHNLLQVLGSSEDEKVQLASITSFYRAVVEREQSFHPGGEVDPSRSAGAVQPQHVVGGTAATTPSRRRSVLGGARAWSSLANRATSPSSPLLEED